MREAIWDNAVLSAIGVPAPAAVPASASAAKDSAPPDSSWDAERFSHAQIRGMVRQLFFACEPKPVRQVVFSAIERETDIRSLCLRVGESLALETDANVAVVGKYPQLCQAVDPSPRGKNDLDLRRVSTRLSGNLWLVPAPDTGNTSERSTMVSLDKFLCELRSEFEYSIVAAPAAEEWNQAPSMGQLTDGTILVLSAQRTRRVIARNIKGALERAHVRILGTVLCDRDFPIPERIYRRL